MGLCLVPHVAIIGSGIRIIRIRCGDPIRFRIISAVRAPLPHFGRFLKAKFNRPISPMEITISSELVITLSQCHQLRGYSEHRAGLVQDAQKYNFQSSTY
jgi:hypothetical protein